MWYINRVGLTKVCYVWKNYLCVIALYEGFVPPISLRPWILHMELLYSPMGALCSH